MNTITLPDELALYYLEKFIFIWETYLRLFEGRAETEVVLQKLNDGKGIIEQVGKHFHLKSLIGSEANVPPELEVFFSILCTFRESREKLNSKNAATNESGNRAKIGRSLQWRCL